MLERVGWTRWPSDNPSNLKHSVILQLCEKLACTLSGFPFPQFTGEGWELLVGALAQILILHHWWKTPTSFHLDKVFGVGTRDTAGTYSCACLSFASGILLPLTWGWLNWIILPALVGSLCFSADCQSGRALDTYWQLNQELVSPISLLS